MRLGQNKGRYCGETIDISAVSRDIHQAALRAGWEWETFHEPLNLRAYRRAAPEARLKLYLSTGIHGDEPSGPLAVLELLRQNEWPAHLDIRLVPCLNPTGFDLNTRENAEGTDLNRDYRNPQTGEIRAHVAWMERQPRFDLAIVLHEDWEANGFYLYELNPDGRPSLAPQVTREVGAVCPIETAAVVDSWPAAGGVIRPDVPPEARPQWAEALYLLVNKSRFGYTMETPSDFPLSIRVAAHVRAVRAALGAV